MLTIPPVGNAATAALTTSSRDYFLGGSALSLRIQYLRSESCV
jgi:hypothetical protein